MSKYRIFTAYGEYNFTGMYLRERESNNWHYYETIEGDIIHFRKEHMVMVIESPHDKG